MDVIESLLKMSVGYFVCGMQSINASYYDSVEDDLLTTLLSTFLGLLYIPIVFSEFNTIDLNSMKRTVYICLYYTLVDTELDKTSDSRKFCEALLSKDYYSMFEDKSLCELFERITLELNQMNLLTKLAIKTIYWAKQQSKCTDYNTLLNIAKDKGAYTIYNLCKIIHGDTMKKYKSDLMKCGSILQLIDDIADTKKDKASSINTPCTVLEYSDAVGIACCDIAGQIECDRLRAGMIYLLKISFTKSSRFTEWFRCRYDITTVKYKPYELEPVLRRFIVR